jgi:hypothetical protein
VKFHRLLIFITIAASLLMITACGGGGGGDSIGYGDLAISLVDAKPLLPDGVTNFTVTITEVLAHGKGGWESLEMPYTPYTSENLKTDKDIIFNVPNGGSVDLVIDFDLSQSLVVTDDGTGTLSYICKPVLHIVDYFEAASMTGIIADDSFTNFSTDTANITVLANGEIYTEVIVDRNPNPAEFSIFWLVPNKDYTIEIDMNPDDELIPETIPVSGDDLGSGIEKDLGSITINNPSPP